MHRILLIFILGLVSTGCFRKDLHPTFPEDLGVQSQPASVDAQKLISGVYRYHSEFVIELKADGNYLANDKIYFQSDTDTSHLGSCVFRVAGTYELRQITGKGDGVYYENGQPFAKDFSHAKYALVLNEVAYQIKGARFHRVGKSSSLIVDPRDQAQADPDAFLCKDHLEFDRVGTMVQVYPISSLTENYYIEPVAQPTGPLAGLNVKLNVQSLDITDLFFADFQNLPAASALPVSSFSWGNIKNGPGQFSLDPKKRALNFSISASASTCQSDLQGQAQVLQVLYQRAHSQQFLLRLKDSQFKPGDRKPCPNQPATPPNSLGLNTDFFNQAELSFQ